MLDATFEARVTAAAAFALVLLARSADAQISGSTVLTFDIPGTTTVPQSYGDNVSGPNQGSWGYGGTGSFTPGIDVSYSLSPQSVPVSLLGSSFGNLVNVAYDGSQGATTMTLTFTAIPGQLVVLIGFDVAPRGGLTTVLSSVTVRNGTGTLLGSLANVAMPWNPSGHVDVDFNPPLAAQVIQLEMTAPLGHWWYLGLDNVTFGQAASGLPVGQANSAAATLRVNGFGPAGLAGLFQVFVPSSGSLTLEWAGPPGMPLALATGNPNSTGINLGCIGLLDIGTPPAFADLTFVFNGALPGLSNVLFQLGPQGTATQTFTLAGLSGLSASIQGAVVQPQASGCPARLTAAFTLTFL